MSTATQPANLFGLQWFGQFLTSSIGRKLVMSLTGLFLISFLLVHLAGNLQILINDGGESFNKYAYMMTHNPFIKTISYLLYISILIHAVQGWLLWRKNRIARGSNDYKVKVTRAVNTNASAAKNMAAMGTIIFIFILLHMYQFWLQMKLGNVNMVTYAGQEYKDLYTPVVYAFQNPLFVIIYILSMVVIAFHMLHGFQSAFQTLGLNHKKYSPLIRSAGTFLSVIISTGFALIPAIIYGQSLGWW